MVRETAAQRFVRRGKQMAKEAEAYAKRKGRVRLPRDPGARPHKRHSKDPGMALMRIRSGRGNWQIVFRFNEPMMEQLDIDLGDRVVFEMDPETRRGLLRKDINGNVVEQHIYKGKRKGNAQVLFTYQEGYPWPNDIIRFEDVQVEERQRYGKWIRELLFNFPDKVFEKPNFEQLREKPEKQHKIQPPRKGTYD